MGINAQVAEVFGAFVICRGGFQRQKGDLVLLGNLLEHVQYADAPAIGRREGNGYREEEDFHRIYARPRL